MEGREGCAGIAEQNSPNVGDKGGRSCCVCKAYAVVRGVRICDPGVFAGGLPVKVAAVYNHAADCRSVTADELGCAVYNDVGAVFDRADQVRRCKGAVNHQGNLMIVRDLCNLFDINDVGIGVTQGFDKDCLGVFPDGFFKCAVRCRIHKGCGDAGRKRKSMCQ